MLRRKSRNRGGVSKLIFLMKGDSESVWLPADLAKQDLFRFPDPLPRSLSQWTIWPQPTSTVKLKKKKVRSVVFEERVKLKEDTHWPSFSIIYCFTPDLVIKYSFFGGYYVRYTYGFENIMRKNRFILVFEKQFPF